MKFFLALLAGASVAALPVAFAGAAPDPSQTPCATNPVVKDGAKDENVAYTPLTADPTRRTGEDPNLDIRSYYYTYRTVDGKPKVTAHIAVTNLSKNVPDEAGPESTIHWYADFATFNNVTWLRAKTDGTDVTFEYGKIGSPVATTTATETTGKFTEGPDGVVSIDWPADVPFPAGTKLDAAFALTTQSGDIEENAVRVFADDAPNGAGATAADRKPYTVAECPAEQTSTNTDTNSSTQTTTTPTTQQPPQQQPPQQQQPQQQQQQGQLAPGSPLPATGTLTADAAVDKGKRKTAIKRGLRARMRCSVQCKVKATASISKKTARKLKLGRKAMKIGTGKASITKAGRIPFSVKLTKKAKRALKRKGVKKFALTVAFQVSDNQGKQTKKITRKSTLR